MGERAKRGKEKLKRGVFIMNEDRRRRRRGCDKKIYIASVSGVLMFFYLEKRSPYSEAGGKKGLNCIRIVFSQRGGRGGGRGGG